MFAQARAAEPPPAPVSVVAAVEQALAPVAWYTGAVLSRRDAEMPAEVAGRLVWVADVGDSVEQDGVVARLDDDLVRQRLLENEASVAGEQARLGFLDKEVARLKRLAQTNIAAQSQLDEAQSNLAATRSDLAAAEARVSQARQQLQRSQLRAPFPGVVTERYREAGEWAGVGEKVLRLVDPVALEVQTQVPVSTLPFVKVGDELKLVAGTYNDVAQVQSVVPVGDDRSRLYELRLKPASTQWTAGQTVRVGIPTAEARAVVAVPRDALVLRRDGARVYRIKDDDTAEPVMVTTGVAAGDLIEVRGGIRAGDRVVTRGGERLRPGQKVSMVPGGAPP
ncbi:MAG: hypothetical protein AMJ69_11890 [Gammaproteobacteria bacterium SG8_47]|nr:MAG: hypothetical protein AMJ69_11890 [Gammaproteobacteria bacterium SG8_47]